jgi:hypothetical protein
MPAFPVEIEHRVTDQVFSYYHGDKMLHFNATLLARLHKQIGPSQFAKVSMDLTQETYDLCMNHRGIEEEKVNRLRARDLRQPGYGVLFEDDGSFTLIDGHHRLVKRWRIGLRSIGLYVCFEEVWRHCLVSYTAEHEARLMAAMPAKVDDPALMPTHVSYIKGDQS